MRSFNFLRKNQENLFFIFFIFLLIFLKRFELKYYSNERDVLPYAYSVFNKNWLPNDWYLSLKIQYRYLFSYAVGFLVQCFGFLKAAFLGRISSYILFSYAFVKLIRSIGINSKIALGLFTLYITAFFGGMGGAKEWMIGGLETKVFAYPLVLLSLAYVIEKKISKSLFFAGLSFSLHLLVGGYYSFCIGVVLIFQLLKGECQFVKILKAIPFYLFSATFGLYGVFINFTTPQLSEGWNIYVNYRVAHHTLPLWETSVFVLFGLFTLINFILFFLSKNKIVKSISIFNLSNSFVTIVGLFIYFFGNQLLLRYYFFRFSDALLPLLTILNLYFFLQSKYTITSTIKNTVLGFFLTLFFLTNFDRVKILFTPSYYINISERSSFNVEMSSWIKENTSKHDVFIVSPTLSNFQVSTERSVFVTLKSSPQASKDLIEWHKRIRLLINKPLVYQDFKASYQLVKDSYKQITTDNIVKIKEQYPELTYLCISSAVDLDFEIAYQVGKFKLYKL